MASTSQSLVNVYLATRDYDRASKNFEVVLKINEKVFGNQHKETIEVRKQLKRVKKKIKKFKKKS